MGLLWFLESFHLQSRSLQLDCKPTVEQFKNYPIAEDLKHFQGDYEKEYPDYISAINRIDYNLGKLVDKLKEKNIFDDTIIIYTSDHGSHFKTRNFEYKRSCHDSSIHIPLVIVGGEYNSGQKSDDIVSLIDLPVSLLKMAQIDVPKQYMGNDLADTKTKRDCAFVQISESHCGRAIRTKDYTYSVKAPAFGYIMPTKESSVYFDDYLYDNNKDPNQLKNLIKDKQYNQVKADLRKMLINQMKIAGEKEPKIFNWLIAKQK